MFSEWRHADSTPAISAGLANAQHLLSPGKIAVNCTTFNPRGLFPYAEIIPGNDEMPQRLSYPEAGLGAWAIYRGSVSERSACLVC